MINCQNRLSMSKKTSKAYSQDPQNEQILEKNTLLFSIYNDKTLSLEPFPKNSQTDIALSQNQPSINSSLVLERHLQNSRFSSKLANIKEQDLSQRITFRKNIVKPEQLQINSRQMNYSRNMFDNMIVPKQRSSNSYQQVQIMSQLSSEKKPIISLKKKFEAKQKSKEFSVQSVKDFQKSEPEQYERKKFQSEQKPRKEINKTYKITCFRCGEIGHGWNSCRKPVECYRCKKKGHLARDCKKTVCYNCKGRGHISKDCPKLQDKKVNDQFTKPYKYKRNATIKTREGVQEEELEVNSTTLTNQPFHQLPLTEPTRSKECKKAKHRQFQIKNNKNQIIAKLTYLGSKLNNKKKHQELMQQLLEIFFNLSDDQQENQK